HRAHGAAPRDPAAWGRDRSPVPSSANPVRSYTLLNRESWEWIRFVNPGDLRVADVTCGPCHGREVERVRTSRMAHGALLPGPGLPDVLARPGDPEVRLSSRGFGTLERTDPVFLGIQKTRLFDPTLWFLGTNDQPGDYRSSGCSACHVLYANDTSAVAAAA